MAHFQVQCSVCSVVVSQCRCPSPNKEIRRTVCGKCMQQARERLNKLSAEEFARVWRTIEAIDDDPEETPTP